MSFLVKVILFIIIFPFIIFTRIIYPILPIRFGVVRSYTFGQCLVGFKTYLKTKNGLNFFFISDQLKSQNKKFDEIMSRHICINKIFKYFYGTSSKIPFHKKHEYIWMNKEKELKINYAKIMNSKINLKFNNNEKKEIKEFMELLKIKKKEYICFSSRDTFLSKIFIGKDYKTKFLSKVRNSKIENKLPAMVEMTKKKLTCLRMGVDIKKKILTNNKKIIDYATNYRTELLDIYLPMNCLFYIADNSGIQVPASFNNVQVGITNHIGFDITQTWGIIFIPKKIWLKKRKRYMTLKEMVVTGLASWKGAYEKKYKKFDDEPVFIENTKSEIKDFTIEVYQKVKNKWKNKKEDISMQKKFWDIINEMKNTNWPSFGGPNKSTISTTFLRKNNFFLKDEINIELLN